ncbi:iron chelate uptake ABC transporter family permease subunit, partial [Klebsiella pneumoniae]
VRIASSVCSSRINIAARTLVAPQELATGAMTALVGAPLFIFIAARFFK